MADDDEVDPFETNPDKDPDTRPIMKNEVMDHCGKHGAYYPFGAACPQCRAEASTK